MATSYIAMAPETRRMPSTGGWLAFSCLPILIGLALAAHAGRAVQLGYTPLAVIIGLYLCFRYPSIFVSYVLTLVCLSPMVRRIADFQSIASTERSPILLAPLLVPALVVFKLSPSKLFGPRYFCFLVPLLAIAYGSAIGLVTIHGLTLITGCLGWAIPVLFGLYCTSVEGDQNTLSEIFVKGMVLFGILVSIYGLIQFFFPTPWDVQWLSQMQAQGLATSMGTPEPQGIRVFSTMNSPATAAAFLAASFLLTSQLRAWWRVLPMSLIAAALVLTSVRAVWLACIVGGCILIVRASTKAKIQFVCALVVLIPLGAAALNTPVGEKVQERFSTFGSIQKDPSYLERRAGFAQAEKFVLDTPFGAGIGYLQGPGAANPHFSASDIGALPIPIELGYIGAGLYALALVFICGTILRRSLAGDGIVLGLAVVAASMLCLFADENPMTGAVGLFFWIAVGLLDRQSASGSRDWVQRPLALGSR